MPTNLNEWFTFLEKFIRGISALKQPMDSLVAKSSQNLNSGGFKIAISDPIIKKVVQSIGKNIVKRLEEKNIFQDIKGLLNTILRVNLFGQIRNFIGVSSFVTYIANSGNNLVRFFRDELLIA